jgi:hypothetical protein
MWLEKLKDINAGKLKGPLKYLNLSFELHNAIYVIEILDSLFVFSINDDELCITKDKKKMNEDQFLYWWQITRYSEVMEEEKKIISSFEGVKTKVVKLQKSIPKIEDEDSEKDKKLKKIEEINTKLTKLVTYLNKEGPTLKHNLTLLSNFRNMYSNQGSLKEILKWVKFNLEQS